ncbi:uncharacterized protein PFL1_05118 [Pseudozyma flocculosa PF-1]|uniref:Expansin-like EG45 domain-containing protein n=1 Tax=Pseudozyma flocculosa PF-1 TaxID=1277687 RepID=A0A061H5D0_9BASI|nr:uncharacterized protein PFL1_05118 [Pseudozyma flocculosa PF-1]EPQ27195.1 hypothetical protein PFL1_05118 [Pseudozyma flocculosa PF-1]
MSFRSAMLALALLLSWQQLLSSSPSAFAFTFPTEGQATLTHYTLPSDYVASCGCVGRSTHYPTAALNRLAYGSNTSFAPSCGLCFELRLVSTPLANPPPPPDDPDAPWGDGIFYPDSAVASGQTPSVVVKITDLCPGAGGPWCNATMNPDGTLAGNQLGSLVHFDLAWPSVAIPNSFFPGDHDYGVWNVSYAAVSCDRWKGNADQGAVGSDWDQQDAACCPRDPAPSGTDVVCPAYYDTVGDGTALVPNTSNILSKGKSSASSASLATHPLFGPSSTTTTTMMLACGCLFL